MEKLYSVRIVFAEFGLLLLSFGCRSRDPLPPISSAQVSLKLLFMAEEHYRDRVGRFGDVGDLVDAGFLDRTKFSALQRGATGFYFKLSVNKGARGFTYVAIGTAPAATEYFITEEGVVHEGRPDN